MKTLYYFVIFHLCIVNSLSGQFRLSSRYQKDVNQGGSHEFEVVSLREKGLFSIHFENIWQYSKNKEVSLVLHDTTLNVVRTEKINIPYLFLSERKMFFDDKKYLYFFSQGEVEKMVYIFRIDVENFAVLYHEVKLPFRIKLDNYKVSGETVYMTGLLEGKSVAFYYNFLEKTVRLVPSFFTEKEEIISMQSDDSHNEINFIIRNSGMKNCKLLIRPYSNLIGSQNKIEFQIRDKQTLQTALVYSAENKDKLVLGTFTNNCADNPQGVYVAQVGNKDQNSPIYHRFVDFGNFFNHFRSQKAERMSQKMKEMQEKGKKIKLGTRLMMQEKIYEQNEELLLVIEAYFREYRNSATSPSLSYIPPSMLNLPPNLMSLNTNRGFNTSGTTGIYKFLFSVVCAFDKNGNILWDNIMKLDNVDQTGFYPVLKLGHLKDSTVMAYVKDNQLFSKMTHRYKTLKDEKSQKIENLCAEYQVSEDQHNTFVSWYDNHFILFGEQSVRTVSDIGISNKTVFHISKMSYYPEKEKEKDKDKQEQKEVKSSGQEE